MANAEPPTSQPHPRNNSKLTPYVVVCWIFAAFGGLMFGYNIGISGGISAMDDFLKKFFPTIYERRDHANNYCKYDDPLLQLFTSSLFFAALASSFVASKACSLLGRRLTIRFASLVFMTAAIISGSASNIFVLILGRILFGIGVGFGNESVPLFLSEVAPPHHRGAVNILFQLFITIGILNAALVNYAVSNIHPYGWRLALALTLSVIPSVILFIGSTVIMENPPSLIERGYEKEGRETLQKIRGVEDVENELQQIKLACEKSRGKHSHKRLLKREGVPPLVISVLIQVFQQFTGINAILFYSPVLFRTMGFRSSGVYLFAILAGGVNLLSTVFAIVVMDKVGRRKMLLQACVLMFTCMVGIGAILEVNLKATGTVTKGAASAGVVVVVCLFVMSFAWSWGPLVWVIPSEIFPLETRTAGFAFAVSTNMFFTFIIGQLFLSMLCHMRATVFFFFAAWIVVMGLFVLFFLPETRGVPIDDMADKVWKVHPFWKRFMPQEVKGAEMT